MQVFVCFRLIGYHFRNFSNEVSVLQRYDLRHGIVGSRGLERTYSLRLQGPVVPYEPWNTVTICYLETSGSDYPVTQGHFPEEPEVKLTPPRNFQNSYFPSFSRDRNVLSLNHYSPIVVILHSRLHCTCTCIRKHYSGFVLL